MFLIQLLWPTRDNEKRPGGVDDDDQVVMLKSPVLIRAIRVKDL